MANGPELKSIDIVVKTIIIHTVEGHPPSFSPENRLYPQWWRGRRLEVVRQIILRQRHSGNQSNIIVTYPRPHRNVPQLIEKLNVDIYLVVRKGNKLTPRGHNTSCCCSSTDVIYLEPCKNVESTSIWIHLQQHTWLHMRKPRRR